MARPRPVLEFADGSRPPFEIALPEVLIGRNPDCALHVDAPGVAPQHARLGVHPTEGAYIDDLGSSRIGTLVNGQRIKGRTRLADGAQIEMGSATLVFRAADDSASEVKADENQATMIGAELPDIVKQMLAAQAAKPASKPVAKPSGQARPGAAPPISAADSAHGQMDRNMARSPAPTGKPLPAPPPAAPPANRVVGKPEPEAEENRTMQMDAPDFAALGLKVPPPRATQQGMPKATEARPPQAQAQPTSVGRPPAPAQPTAPTPIAVEPAAGAGRNPFDTQGEMPAPQLDPPSTPAAQPFAPTAPVAPPVSLEPVNPWAQAQAPVQPPSSSPSSSPPAIAPTPAQPYVPQKTPVHVDAIAPVPNAAPPATAFFDAPVIPGGAPGGQRNVAGPSQPPVALGFPGGAMQARTGAGGPDVIRPQDKAMLVLSYLGILSLIPFFTVKDSDYVQWHAKQGLAFAIAGFGYVVAMILLLVVLGLISPLLSLVLYPIFLIGNLGMLAVTVIAIVKAFAPTRWKIPVVSMLAEKLLGQQG